MDYRAVHMRGEDAVLEGVRHFSLSEILGCGQCFRWNPVGENSYRGTVEGKTRTVTQQGDTLIFHGAALEEVESLWLHYFDLPRDYGAVKALLGRDPVTARAIAYAPGMRVLRQPPWEALCSFILSSNNNIVRIRGIVDRLCRCFGEDTGAGYAFPTPERLAALDLDELEPLRCGYRAAYLLDAARRVASGALELEPLYTLPLPEARRRLTEIKGVGPKVAECVLLYGFSRTECVPVDVWIRRALDHLYPQGIPGVLAPLAGLAQQYLFHYVRNCPEALRAG